MLDLLEQIVGWLAILPAALGLMALRTRFDDNVLRRELRGAILFLLGGIAFGVGSQLVTSRKLADASTYLRVAAFMLLAFGGIRAASSIAHHAMRRRVGAGAPKIVRDVIDVVLYLFAAAIILRATLKLDLGGLVATSAVLSVVIGLALQETLGNLFAGLALQMERPFNVGDWISAGGHTGRVLQIAWRATRILTPRREEITIPNSVIGKECVVNFSRGGNAIARDLLLEIDYDSPPNAVRAACLEVLAAHPAVLQDPPPVFRLSKWEASGVQYQLRYFVSDFNRVDDVAAELLSQLWYRVRREGFSIPFPTRTVYVKHEPESANDDAWELAPLLSSIDFLRPLGPDGAARLARTAHRQLFGRGETIIRQGDPGESFFAIVSGEVSVRTSAAGEVARLRRGDFFGEMSLLTGEPRAATIVAECDSVLLRIERTAFGEILRASDTLANALSDALASRSADLKAHAVGAGGSADGAVSLESKRILARLRDIFTLK